MTLDAAAGMVQVHRAHMPPQLLERRIF